MSKPETADLGELANIAEIGCVDAIDRANIWCGMSKEFLRLAMLVDSLRDGDAVASHAVAACAECLVILNREIATANRQYVFRSSLSGLAL